MLRHPRYFSPLLFFFNATATTEIYTLSLHDALPISSNMMVPGFTMATQYSGAPLPLPIRTSADFLVMGLSDRKSTRLNSSHVEISYAVFCLKKKKKNNCAISTHINDQDSVISSHHRI